MTFQEQNDLLLQSYLDNYCKKRDTVEFVFSSVCDQRCEYCYLQRYAEDMNYARANKKEDILRNLDIFLTYLEENNYDYKTYDIFSGEFFNLPYWTDIMDIFYEHQKKVLKRRDMSIPSNFSFISDKEKVKVFEDYLVKFSDVNCSIHLSCSIDGPDFTESVTRPNLNPTVVKDEQFYDDVFKFLAKHYYSFHPMIGKTFLQNYKQNYDWFIDNIIKYKILFCSTDNQYNWSPPMLLEVRDDEQWDDETIKLYREFLFYVFEKDLNALFDGDMEAMMYHMFDDFSPQYQEMTGGVRNQPYIIGYPTASGDILSCSIQKNFICRIGDLTMAPCHRLYYSNFEYGRFVLNEEKTKIIGVEGKNPTLAFKIAMFNPIRSALKCGDCKYKLFCLKGCLGSQYEHTKEMFGAQEHLCKAFDTKYRTIHDICNKYDLYTMFFNNVYIPKERKEFVAYVREFMDNR